jgi:cell division protease FtsH
MDELEDAKDKVMMGAERRSMVMTEDEKKLTAYHEGGHAIVALNIPESDPIHKATIIPRGLALGMVMQLPEKDRISISRVKLEADLSVLAGGRIAEEMIFGRDKITTGASSDINQATKMARRMIIEWGMSEEKLGFLSYAGEGAQEVFLGHSTTASKNISASTAKIIDDEIRALVDKTYDRAKKILENNREALELLAQGLLEHETLTGDDIKKIVDGQKIVKQKKIEIVKTTKKSKMPTSEYVDKIEKSSKKTKTTIEA